MSGYTGLMDPSAIAAQQVLDAMPWYQRTAVGMGKSFTDTARGVRQLLGNLSQDQIDEAARYDSPLMGDTAGALGYMGGALAQSVGAAGGLGRLAAALGPAVRSTPLAELAAHYPRWMAALRHPATLAGTGGAGFAATQPVTSGNTRMGNAVQSGLMSAGLTGLGMGVSRAMRPTADYINAQMQPWVDEARRLGLRLRDAQVLPGDTIAQLRAHTVGQLPGSGVAHADKEQLKQFTRLATGTFGEASDNLPAAVGRARGRLGMLYDDIEDRNALYLTQGDLSTFRNTIANSNLTPDGVKKYNRWVDDLYNTYSTNGVIPGSTFKDWIKKLNAQRNSFSPNSAEQDAGRSMLATLKQAMQRNMSTEDQVAYAQADRQWANMKFFEPAARGSEFKDGIITPDQLTRMMLNASGKNQPYFQAMTIADSRAAATPATATAAARPGTPTPPLPMQPDSRAQLAQLALTGRQFLGSVPPERGFNVGGHLVNLGASPLALGTLAYLAYEHAGDPQALLHAALTGAAGSTFGLVAGRGANKLGAGTPYAELGPWAKTAAWLERGLRTGASHAPGATAGLVTGLQAAQRGRNPPRSAAAGPDLSGLGPDVPAAMLGDGTAPLLGDDVPADALQQPPEAGSQ